ncbi:MAG: aromatic amino acid ammonia-lyase [Pseudomonadota bacterium]
MEGNNQEVRINGHMLTPEQVISVARTHAKVVIDPPALKALTGLREGLQELINQKIPMYGVNTGCGSRKNIILEPEDLSDYQMRYIPAHCCGFGEPMPEEVVRAAMLIRLNNFLKGCSGLRPEIALRLADYLNLRITPIVPRYGSVGASGDLVPLAHVTSVMIEDPHARVWYDGNKMSAHDAHRLCNLDRIVLEAKEAMGMTNGVNFLAAIGCLAWHDTSELLDVSCLATALSVEAIRGEMNAFDPRIHEAREFMGQLYTAKMISELLVDSSRTKKAAREYSWERKDDLGLEYQPKKDKKGRFVPRVQDAYSFRCAPQIMAPLKHALDHAYEMLKTEINSATDNPLIFKDPDAEHGYSVLSAGNFHGQPLAQLFAYLASSLAPVSGVSDRRLFALLSSKSSFGLPDDLAGPSPNNTGYMIAQYATAALQSQIQVLATPACNASTPTSANQEDWVSMGMTQAMNLRELIPLVRTVLATELLGATRGIALIEPVMSTATWPLGTGTRVAYQEIVQIYADELAKDPTDLENRFRDRYFAADVNRVVAMLEDGYLMRQVYYALK